MRLTYIYDMVLGSYIYILCILKLLYLTRRISLYFYDVMFGNLYSI